jgi:hypothetical protein
LKSKQTSDGSSSSHHNRDGSKRIWKPKAKSSAIALPIKVDAQPRNTLLSESGSSHSSSSSSNSDHQAKAAKRAGKAKLSPAQEVAEQLADAEDRRLAASDVIQELASENEELAASGDQLRAQLNELENALAQETSAAAVQAQEHRAAEDALISRQRAAEDVVVTGLDIELITSTERSWLPIIAPVLAPLALAGIATMKFVTMSTCGALGFTISQLLWPKMGRAVTIGSCALMAVGYAMRRPTVETFKYVGPVEYNLVDRRPDCLAMGELKHADARYAKVAYTSKCGLYSAIAHKLLHKKVPGITHQVGLFGGKIITDMIVSTEVVRQLAVPQTLDLSSTPQVAWDRITYMAKSLHSVNVNRDYALQHEFVIQQSALVAFALYREMRQKLGHLPFPSPLLV